MEQVLLPSLRPGLAVVLGSLAAHKGERVRELVEGRDCELLFLPPTRRISTLYKRGSLED